MSMEQPTISVTVHSKCTQEFSAVLNIEDELDELLKWKDALTFKVDLCVILLNSIKGLPWTKFRACQHVRLYFLLLRLKSYGRIDLENSKNHSKKAIGKLKTMRKICRSICRQFMVMFNTEDFDVFDGHIRKYEAVIVSGFPLKIWYLADEKLADVIARDFKTKTMSRAQRFFYDFCLQIDLEHFVNDTNIRKLLENEIKQICGQDNDLCSFHLRKINIYEESAFKEFIELEESWCWTTLSDLAFKDDASENQSAFLFKTIMSPEAKPKSTTTSDSEYETAPMNEIEERIANEEIEPTSLTITDKINDALRTLTEHNLALCQADLGRIESFLLSSGTIQPENVLAQFFAYKKKQKSTQTQEDEDTNTADSIQRLTKSLGTQSIAESIHDNTQLVDSQQLMFADNSIFVSSQLARILDDQSLARTTPPTTKTITRTPQIEASSYFTIRNHLTFSQISEINFHIVCPIQRFTINLKFFGNCDYYCLDENSVCQLLNINDEQWITLRKVFVEVGFFEYQAKKNLPRGCSQLYKYLYYLFKTIDLVKGCISFVPDMHSNNLRAVRESNFVHVQRQPLCLDGIIDNEILRKMHKEL